MPAKNAPCSICGEPSDTVCDDCSAPVCFECLDGDVCKNCADGDCRSR